MALQLASKKVSAKARQASQKIVSAPLRQLASSELSAQWVENVSALRTQLAGLKIVLSLRAQFDEDPRENVAALRRQLELAVLSLAPGFSQVSGTGNMEKPFQRFLRAGGKPLKRFTCRAAANTRLKPGANERTDRSGIHVASYLTKLIPKKRLEQKFHEAVKMARARLQSEIPK